VPNLHRPPYHRLRAFPPSCKVPLLLVFALNPLVAEQPAAEILDCSQGFFAGWDDVVGGEQESIAACVTELDLVRVWHTRFVVEPVKGGAAACFDAWPDGALLVIAPLPGCNAPFARRCHAVDLTVGEADRFGETDGQFLQVLERWGRVGAGVGIGVEHLLGVAVEVEEADEGDVVVLGLIADPVCQSA